MAGALPGGPDDPPGGGDGGSNGPVDRGGPRPPDVVHELTPGEKASIHEWYSRRRMASAERLGLSRPDAERLEHEFDGDLGAYVAWRRSRGEELPAALEGLAGTGEIRSDEGRSTAPIDQSRVAVERWTVAWTAKRNGQEPSPNPEVHVGSVDELDQRLDEIDAKSRQTDPLLVDLYDSETSDLPSLAIGVGADRSVVTWTAPEGGAGSMISKGQGPSDSESWFVSAGEPTFFSGDQLVPLAQAREAMRIFMRTRQRPENVEWVEI